MFSGRIVSIFGLMSRRKSKHAILWTGQNRYFRRICYEPCLTAILIVETLAQYLHLTPQQVIKLAERGHLPGRKIGGEWKFAKPDIHQWFENRIGLSDEEELVQVESVLQRSAPLENEREIRISELLPVEAIAVPLYARTRSAVIDGMVELGGGHGMAVGSEGHGRRRPFPRRNAPHGPGKRRGLDASAPADAQNTRPTVFGLGLHFKRHTLRQRLPTYRCFFPDLFGRRPRPSAYPRPIKPPADNTRPFKPIATRCRMLKWPTS